MTTIDLETKVSGIIRPFKKPSAFTEQTLFWPIKTYDEVCHTVRGSLLKKPTQRLEFAIKKDQPGYPVGIAVLADGSVLTICADEKTRKLAKRWLETNQKALDQISGREKNPFQGTLVGKIPPIEQTANRPILVLSYIISKGPTHDDTNTVCVDAISMQTTLLLGEQAVGPYKTVTQHDHGFGKDLLFAEILRYVTVDVEKGNEKIYCPDLDTEVKDAIIGIPVQEVYPRAHPIDGYGMVPITYSSTEHMRYMAFRKKAVVGDKK